MLTMVVYYDIYNKKNKFILRIMNLSNPDRYIRLISGLGLVTFDYLASANWEVIFLFVGAWGVLTSVFGYCPFYRLMGYNTCPTKLNV